MTTRAPKDTERPRGRKPIVQTTWGIILLRALGR